MYRGSHRTPTKGRSEYLIVLLVVGMFLTLGIPAAAGNHAMATGDVYWTNYNGSYTGIHTVLSLHDDPPGAVSAYGDRGWVYQDVPGKGEIWIEVDCVEITGTEARWGGHTVNATDGYVGTSYMTGWLNDVATPGAEGDQIGSQGLGTDPCPNLTFTGSGTVTGGNLSVHPITTP